MLLLFFEKMPQLLEFMSGQNLSPLFNAFPTHLVDYRLTWKNIETGPLTMAHERHTLQMVVEADTVTLDGAVRGSA